MKITTCTINVGNGEGNKNLALDVLWFVDVFIILDCSVNSRGEYVEHENREYEMVSSVENGDVEIYIRKSMVEWITIESHEKEGVIMRYEEEGTGIIKRIGAVYVRPLRETRDLEKRMEELERCDLIIGDLNARNPIWGKDAGDEEINAYGRKLQQWINNNDRVVAKTNDKTFRQSTVLDITIYKRGDETPNRTLTDKCGFEHMGQIVRLRVKRPQNLMRVGVEWKKVNWKEMEENLKSLKIGEDGGWEELKDILENLPKKKSGKRENEWWTKDLEQMAKDMRKLRRESKTEWKLARKIFRMMMINRRYENMKMKLRNMKDLEIFKAIKQLEGKRAIPPIRKRR